MSEGNITAAEVSEWLKTNEKKAVWLAQTLRVTPATVSRWLNEKNPITGSDESILKLLIRGEMPFEIANEKLLHGVLDFTTDQWRVICILSNRNSITPGLWIANQIRSYLAFNEEAKSVHAEIIRNRLQAMPPPEEQEDAKVADEPK